MVMFSRRLEKEELLSLIKRGRAEAMADQGAGAASWAGVGIDWDGPGLPIPAATAVEAPKVRVRQIVGKQNALGALPIADGESGGDVMGAGAWVLASTEEGRKFGKERAASGSAARRGKYGLDRDV